MNVQIDIRLENGSLCGVPYVMFDPGLVKGDEIVFGSSKFEVIRKRMDIKNHYNCKIVYFVKDKL